MEKTENIPDNPDTYICLKKEGDSWKDITSSTGEYKGVKGEYYLYKKTYYGRSDWYGGYSYVDLLVSGVTEKFIETTMKGYEKAVGNEFGKAVPGVFTDEPNIVTSGGLRWTPDLFDVFRQRWGYDLKPLLPLLSEETGDWKRVRHFRRHMSSGKTARIRVFIIYPHFQPHLFPFRDGIFIHFNTLTKISLDVDKCRARKFGITAFHQSGYHYDLYLSGGTGKLTFNFSKSIHGGNFRTACIPFDRRGPVTLFVFTDKSKYAFGFETENCERVIIGEGANIGLASEAMNPRSYTGTMIGVFCEDGMGVISHFEMLIAPKGNPIREIKPSPLDATLSELLANERAASILHASLPDLMNNPMLGSIKSMSLRKLSAMDGGMFPVDMLAILEQKLKGL